jgi:hypothetical protein
MLLTELLERRLASSGRGWEAGEGKDEVEVWALAAERVLKWCGEESPLATVA